MTTYLPGTMLPANVLLLMRFLIDHVAPPSVADALHAQAETATLLSGSATMIDLEQPAGGARIDLPNGPIPVRAFVSPAGKDPTGELLVWVRDGNLIGLEQAWWTDDPPQSWPSPDVVRVR